MIDPAPIVASYVFPIAVLVVGLIILSSVLSLIRRAGTQRDPDPAVRAIYERRFRARR